MPKVINRAIHLRMFAGFCFNNISAPPQISLHRQFSSAQFQKLEEMMGDGLWCYCCRFVLNSKRPLSTSCNKQGHSSASSIFFMVLFPMLFEVRRIVCRKLTKSNNVVEISYC